MEYSDAALLTEEHDVQPPVEELHSTSFYRFIKRVVVEHDNDPTAARAALCEMLAADEALFTRYRDEIISYAVMHVRQSIITAINGGGQERKQQNGGAAAIASANARAFYGSDEYKAQCRQRFDAAVRAEQRSALEFQLPGGRGKLGKAHNAELDASAADYDKTSKTEAHLARWLRAIRALNPENKAVEEVIDSNRGDELFRATENA
jgi:hypothetical protein